LAAANAVARPIAVGTHLEMYEPEATTCLTGAAGSLISEPDILNAINRLIDGLTTLDAPRHIRNSEISQIVLHKIQKAWYDR
jgi:hypothetical protein